MHAQEQVLPSYKTELELANRSVEYFHSKVASIRQVLGPQQGDQTPEPLGMAKPATSSLDTLSIISLAELHKLIMAAPTKSCMLDPAPTWFIKEPAVLETVLPSMLTAVNNSLTSRVVPPFLKQAVITPIISRRGYWTTTSSGTTVLC